MKKLSLFLFISSLSILISCNNDDYIDYHANIQKGDISKIVDVDFSIDNKDNTLLEKDELLISNNSVNALTYHWDFGNGDTSSEAQPNYHYNIHGYYTVILTTNDIYGNTKKASQEILVLCRFAEKDHSTN